MAISFQNQNIQFVLKHKSNTKVWLKSVVLKQKKALGELNFVFTNDEELLKYNQHYLKHNTFTDVITFDNSDSKKISGDIIISIERVKENAQKFNIDFEIELRRVLVHGVLHLLGFKDKTKSAILEMRNT